MTHTPRRRLLLLALALAVTASESSGAGRSGGWDMDRTTDLRKAQDQDGVIFDKRNFAYCNRCVFWGLVGGAMWFGGDACWPTEWKRDLACVMWPGRLGFGGLG